jgi:hypothetical protein
MQNEFDWKKKEFNPFGDLKPISSQIGSQFKAKRKYILKVLQRQRASTNPLEVRVLYTVFEF